MSNRSKDDQISPISEIDPEVKSYSKDLTKRLARARQGAAAGQASPTNDFLDRLADRLSRVNAQAAAWQANLTDSDDNAPVHDQMPTPEDVAVPIKDREVSASDFALPRIVHTPPLARAPQRASAASSTPAPPSATAAQRRQGPHQPSGGGPSALKGGINDVTDNLKAAFREVLAAGHELVTLATVSDYMLGTRTPPTVQEAERAFRQYIWFFKENGHELAAEMAEHYLAGSGVEKVFYFSDLANYSAFQDAILTLQNYAETSFTGQIGTVMLKLLQSGSHFERPFLYDKWDRLFHTSIIPEFIISQVYRDLYYAIGKSFLSLELIFEVKRNGSDVSVNGSGFFNLEDVYDCKNGEGSAVASMLEGAGIARTFDMKCSFYKDFEGSGTIGDPSMNLNWSSIRENIGSTP